MKSFYFGDIPISVICYRGVKYKLKKSIKNGKPYVTLVKIDTNKENKETNK